MNQNKSLIFIYSVIGVLIIIGAIASNENFNNYLDTHPIINVLYNAFLVIGAIIVALVFIMGRTGERFSWKMLLIAILVASVFVGFGIMKKLV